MYNLFINFAKVVQDNLQRQLRTPRRLKFLYAARKPFRIMFSEFWAKVNELKYRASHNGQVISLEHSLNDLFDDTQRRIYIEDATLPKLYWYRKVEAKPAPILYKRWNGGTYTAGQFAVVNNIVYECNTGHTNKTPGVDPEWTATARTIPILYKKVNFNGGIAFRVMVPASLVYDANKMHAHIKSQKLAGFGYIIKTF